jgi:hypothetical protein
MDQPQIANGPLSEVFGFPLDAISDEAARHRSDRLCPFNNGSANCTKDKAENPLGTCSVTDPKRAIRVVTCPSRFRQNWRIASDAAAFFFPPGATWTTVSEIRLEDARGNEVGNIDHVLVQYDEAGRVIDFGTVEVQAVYVSGNVRRPFEAFQQKPETYFQQANDRTYRVRPDYLSSRKRLIPQLASKGSILNKWGKRQAIVLDAPFFRTFPEVRPCEVAAAANLAWLIYEIEREPGQPQFDLRLARTVLTDFQQTLDSLHTTEHEPGPLSGFVALLQQRLTEQLRTGTTISFPGGHRA